MSLFEDSTFRWRETYFVLFQQKYLPTREKVCQLMSSCGFELGSTKPEDEDYDETGLGVPITVLFPDDHAAMDISLVTGEDVEIHRTELLEQLDPSDTDEKTLNKIAESDARFDLYHFESALVDPEMDIDPGSLILVLEQLVRLCRGVGIDPLSGTTI